MRALATVCVLALATTAQAGWFDNLRSQITSFFQTYEEAPYNVAATYPGFEERQYPAKKWVCTQRTVHIDDDNGEDGMFWKLFTYIQGSNNRDQNIDMTVPVTREYTVNGPTKTYEMCFYIGAEHQDDPATPNDAQVVVRDRPTINVYTRTVGGYLTEDEDWLQEANRLKELIEATGRNVNMNHMYWVGYDAPTKFFNRRNEVWFLVE